MRYELWYNAPAPTIGDELRVHDGALDPNDGWEKWSLPIGCGWFGANVFGRTTTERIQITENSLVTRRFTGEVQRNNGGVANFAELFLDFGHETVTEYRRSLDLSTAIAKTEYIWDGARYTREVFASYPDRVLVVGITASKPGALSFFFRPEMPFGGRDREDTYRTTEKNTVTFGGIYGEYRVRFSAAFRLFVTGGHTVTEAGGIRVVGADRAYIVAAFGTNYRLSSHVFTAAAEEKLSGNPDPYPAVQARLDAASAKSYETLRKRHIADYGALFGRVTLDLGEDMPTDLPTDALLRKVQDGGEDRYLESLYFQYGRYLLLSSARPGTLPPHLQGIWNRYDAPPWGSGYWHNINIQMNYWPAFVTAIPETFAAYIDFAKAYRDAAEHSADRYIGALYPDRLSPEKGGNGWAIGTAAWPYTVEGISTSSHSGPGTGAFTTQLFWDAYAFSEDKALLSDFVYPSLYGMATFLEKTLIRRDGHWLVEYSASPEQPIVGEGYKWNDYYHTCGCTFDQSMVWECFTETLRAAEILGITDDPFLDVLREKLPDLDPIQIGADGQIKEFREETHYGEIGEPHHRHISHLVGAYPGTLITKKTPEWLRAVEKTLDFRGDKSTGWAMAHRLTTWARTGNGRRAYMLYHQLLATGTMPNLWDTHPPFQIDGNLGGCAGVAEMLLQSPAGAIDILPTLPPQWTRGSFRGLRARGAISVDAAWENGALTEAAVTPDHDREIRLCGVNWRVALDGTAIPTTVQDGNTVFAAEGGRRYTLRQE